jgi:hypothetical protein
MIRRLCNTSLRRCVKARKSTWGPWKVKVARQRCGSAHDWQGAGWQSHVRLSAVHPKCGSPQVQFTATAGHPSVANEPWQTNRGERTVAKRLRLNAAQSPAPWLERQRRTGGSSRPSKVSRRLIPAANTFAPPALLTNAAPHRRCRARFGWRASRDADKLQSRPRALKHRDWARH